MRVKSFAHRDRKCSLARAIAIPHARSLACLHAIRLKCAIVVRSSRYNIKIRSSCVIARILAMWQQEMLMSLLLAIWQKYALASNGIKAKWSHKEREATSQRLRVWRAFLPTFFFEVRFLTSYRKRRRKKAGSKVKSAVKNRISEILLS